MTNQQEREKKSIQLKRKGEMIKLTKNCVQALGSKSIF